MTAEELIRRAAACKKCGKEHQYFWTGERRASWASRDDGHDYEPTVDVGIVARLRYMATGHYEDPWKPKDPPRLGRRRKVAAPDLQGMSDDPRLAELGVYTPEGSLTPGYGDHYLFMVGRDDVHGILLHLISRETMGFKLNMFGYDDDELNDAILTLMRNPGVSVQGSLDKSQAGGVHERKLLEADVAADPGFYNSFVVMQSATHQISHTKGGVFVAQGLAFEGSTNWSASGEGAGIKLDPRATPAPGYKAQNNTLVVTANPVFVARFAARLDVEHLQGLAQQAKKA